MGLKGKLSKWYASRQIGMQKQSISNPLSCQLYWRSYLLHKGSRTAYGIQHQLDRVKDYESWKERIPVKDYEGLQPFIARILEGEPNVLWPNRPSYMAKTSGTTSGAKYIPISKKTMPFHIKSAKMALLSYIHETGKTDFVDGKMIFLQGSPETLKKNGIRIGRLSGITAHHVPAYLQSNRLPSMQVNRIEDWEKKVDAIVEETIGQDLRLISGIPSWVQMYFEKLLDATGKSTVLEVFPNFSLFVHGGVNFAPYSERFRSLIGGQVPSIELYPASEGFIAYQDSQDQEGLLLEVDSGMFFEFIPVDEVGSDGPTRIWLEDVELGVNYVLIINSAAGLWGYNIGDTVRFVSKSPYRLVVTGRVKHFTSAFGEHVIADEVERAASMISKEMGLVIREFHVAPQVSPESGLPYHEWFIEMDDHEKLEEVAERLDEAMVEQNPYCRDLIEGKVLRPLRITQVPSGAFERMMHARGKLGGQNKIPRLANDRSIAELLEYKV